MAKTMDELYAEYNEASKRASREYQAWYANHPAGQTYDNFKGFKLDYNYFQSEIAASIKEKFNFSDAQVGYIMAEAYARYHSAFSDMFWGAQELAEFVTKFPK